MSEEQDQVNEKDQQTIEPTGVRQDELSEKDLDKAVGGDKHRVDRARFHRVGANDNGGELASSSEWILSLPQFPRPGLLRL
jgi:hypothetical protein